MHFIVKHDFNRSVMPIHPTASAILDKFKVSTYFEYNAFS